MRCICSCIFLVDSVNSDTVAINATAKCITNGCRGTDQGSRCVNWLPYFCFYFCWCRCNCHPWIKNGFNNWCWLGNDRCCDGTEVVIGSRREYLQIIMLNPISDMWWVQSYGGNKFWWISHIKGITRTFLMVSSVCFVGSIRSESLHASKKQRQCIRKMGFWTWPTQGYEALTHERRLAWICASFAGEIFIFSLPYVKCQRGYTGVEKHCQYAIRHLKYSKHVDNIIQAEAPYFPERLLDAGVLELS